MRLFGHLGNAWRSTSLVAFPILTNRECEGLVQPGSRQGRREFASIEEQFLSPFFPQNKVVDLRCEVLT